MGGKWKEVVKLSFKGLRFHDHALDLTALVELSRFQKMVAETAKALWRAANPNRERLPRNFEERTRLCLRRIDTGSAVAPLEVYLEQPGLFETEPAEINQAITLAKEVFHAIERDEPLPQNFPKSLVSEYSQWGQTLAESETIEIAVPDKGSASVTRMSQYRLAAFADGGYEGDMELTGEVLEADIRHNRFQVWVDEKTGVTVSFSPEQETIVTSALRDHQTIRLRVVGTGENSPQGKPLRITQVTELQLLPFGESIFDSSARPIEEVLIELASEIPETEWKKLPSGLTDDLDHYIYGTPKR